MLPNCCADRMVWPWLRSKPCSKIRRFNATFSSKVAVFVIKFSYKSERERDSLNFVCIGFTGDYYSFVRSNRFWTSASNTSGAWRWTATNYRALFTNWANKFPVKTAGFNYVAYVPATGEWKNGKSSNHRFTICESDQNEPAWRGYPN